jgi:hypothetical protein
MLGAQGSIDYRLAPCTGPAGAFMIQDLLNSAAASEPLCRRDMPASQVHRLRVSTFVSRRRYPIWPMCQSITSHKPTCGEQSAALRQDRFVSQYELRLTTRWRFLNTCTS